MDRHDGKNPKCDVCFLINLARDQAESMEQLRAALNRLLQSDVRVVKEKKTSGNTDRGGALIGVGLVHPLIRTLTEPGPLVTGRGRRT